jgi:hypothetical protein
MADQIKYSFDAKSIQKMLKGMLYAIAPAVIMGAIAFLQDMKWENAAIGAIMPFLIMFLTNAGKEFIKGLTPQEAEQKALVDAKVASCLEDIKKEIADERTMGHSGQSSGVDKSF